MKIEVLDVSSKFDLIIEEAKAVALSSADDSRLSAYHSENKELEQLDRIACNTLHDCMQKVFEDGPNVTRDSGWEIFVCRHLPITRLIR